MGIRLNKVLSELNIGLQTAVDFLKKRSHLGEVKDDITSNSKISDKQYEDGSQILPLNITPQRTRTGNDKVLLAWLRTQLEDLKEHQYYNRFEIESIETLPNYKEKMEQVIVDSLALREHKRGDKTRVMISYRNSCSLEVEKFRKDIETQGKVEIKVLPPGSLCGDYEAHTPMRRWMLVGLLDDHIRETY